MKHFLSLFVFMIIYLITLLLNENVSSNKSGTIDLNKFWTIQNRNGTYKMYNQSVPSGVYSALEDDQIIESVLFSYNDVNTRWISKIDWIFSLNIPVSDIKLNNSHLILTFYGLDTISKIYLDDKLLGNSNNMFMRYRFDIKPFVKDNENEFVNLTILFSSPVSEAKALTSKYDYKIVPECPPAPYNGECHMNLLRKMQASFSWDWGPAVPSMGIWKPVNVEYYDSAIIRDILFALNHSTEDFWVIDLTVIMESGLEASQEIDGILYFEIIDIKIAEKYQHAIVRGATNDYGEFSFEHRIEIRTDSVDLWWPNGYGEPVLYNLYVKWEDSKANDIKIASRVSLVSDKTIRIGFRTVELIQDVVNKTGDVGLSFYFRVNKIDMFMKGSNYIPSSILPEKSYEREMVSFLLKSATDAHMNMLRVWGGGLYEDDYFYDMADELGILIFHDLMFACAMYPSDNDFLDSVRMEIRQNIRRIQHHPSIAVWTTNNENEAALRQNWYGTKWNFTLYQNDYIKLYVETVRDEAQANDPWREVLVSSPSNGLQTEKEDFVSQNPQDPHYGDVHYYNYENNGWNPVIYRGGRFISEYGFQSFPSLNSWNSILALDDNLSEMIEHRQHFPFKHAPILLMIQENMKLPVNGSENYWRDIIYLSQVSQAVIVKTETEVYRANRNRYGTMGALYWQLNDVWIAPSWSSIEFNGNYKILHQWMPQIMSPKTVISFINEFNNLEIYAVRDTLGFSENWSITMRVYRWNSFTVIDNKSWIFAMNENSVLKVAEFNLREYLMNKGLSKEEHVLHMILETIDGRTLHEDFVFPDKLKNIKNFINPTVKVNVISSDCTNITGVLSVNLEVTTSHPAIFNYIQLDASVLSLRNCQFSNNGFMQFSPITSLYLECNDYDCNTKLTNEDFIVLNVNQLL